jgi:hypothetical protein
LPSISERMRRPSGGYARRNGLYSERSIGSM